MYVVYLTCNQEKVWNWSSVLANYKTLLRSQNKLKE